MKRFLVLAPLLAALPLHAQAGVVIQQKTNFNIAGISNADLQQTMSILGSDRAKTVTTGKMKVLIISKDAAGTEIVRLDQDQIIKLDDKKKKYEIQTLAEVREQLAKAQKDAEKQATEAKEKDDMRYYAVLDEARRTGEKKAINGFSTEQVSIKITIMGENTKTKKTAPYMHLIGDLWVDSGQREAGKVVMGFFEAQQKALGIDPAMATNPYGKWLKDMREQMGKLEGMAIKSTITFEAEVDSATAAENRNNPQSSSPMGPLGGLFGKKKDTAAAKSGSGRPVLFSITTEVLAISNAAPAAAEFEIPAGYTKK